VSNNKGIADITKSIFFKIVVSEYFVLILTIVYFFLIAAIVPSMFAENNLKNIFSNMWPLFAVTIGQTFVLLLAGIDLSQTSIMGLTSVIGAAFMTQTANSAVLEPSPLWGWFITEYGGPFARFPDSVSAILGICVMLLIGILAGTLNGIMIAKLDMPPFMVTLIAQMFYAALAVQLTKSQNIMNLPSEFTNVGFSGLGSIPYSFFITIILSIVAQLLLSKSILGRWIFSIGANYKAARVSGVPVERTTIFVYAFSGFCAAVASVLYSGRLLMGRPTLGANMLMDIMGATIIGGTSMFGGKGKVTWTLFGALFYTILTTSLTQLKLDTFTINIVKGLVILAAATIDITRTRIQQHGIITVLPMPENEDI
jgi:ribose transport system permease protein